jgi:glycine/sarcosine N-methyltransferase
MGRFYRSIAPYYDDIFPLSNVLKGFLDSLGFQRGDQVLDIGCATGEVALYLAERGQTVTGMDLDRDLIDLARAKQSEQGIKNARFVVGNMNHVDRMFSPGLFRFALCLGNTLVHLLSSEEMDRFIEKVGMILSGGGSFVFQILNYDKILAHRIEELPIIDNEKITFQRRYEFRSRKGLLTFRTRLAVKATSEIIHNTIRLYPLRLEEARNMLLHHDTFHSHRFLGGFDGKPFGEEDDLLIGVWKK